MSSRCYFCDAVATSLDHVPPKVFFPESKDLPANVDLRRNLIRVPACDEHNGGYARDDEIAAYTALLHHRSNQVAVQQFATKTIRAFKRAPGLDSRVMLDRREIVASNGSVLYVSRADTAALGRVMDRIARGLYFHDFNRRWTSSLNLVPDGMMKADLSPDPRAVDVSAIKAQMATCQDSEAPLRSSGISGSSSRARPRKSCRWSSTRAWVTWRSRYPSSSDAMGWL
jgi:hypothetical protein